MSLQTVIAVPPLCSNPGLSPLLTHRQLEGSGSHWGAVAGGSSSSMLARFKASGCRCEGDIGLGNALGGRGWGLLIQHVGQVEGGRAAVVRVLEVAVGL